MEVTPATQNALLKYLTEEWWCEKWRYAWLDSTRLPLIANGERTMATNYHDEQLNLQVFKHPRRIAVASLFLPRKHRFSTFTQQRLLQMTWEPKLAHRETSNYAQTKLDYCF
ncbi:hypothetical protein DPMN_184136 [Dreissena polymorpha]|uniref:Uncharacterized protein n=1 Tax=Dreissena polymorpha TaxID=45954 RepID=A0A9D4I641_DREPO|nr:hypothetical protein DPMN_184136 [Dreissena polymorpha]